MRRRGEDWGIGWGGGVEERNRDREGVVNSCFSPILHAPHLSLSLSSHPLLPTSLV